jgi:hypothetical protein
MFRFPRVVERYGNQNQETSWARGRYVLAEEKHTPGILPGSLPPSTTIKLSATSVTVCHNIGSVTKPFWWHRLRSARSGQSMSRAAGGILGLPRSCAIPPPRFPRPASWDSVLQVPLVFEKQARGRQTIGLLEHRVI